MAAADEIDLSAMTDEELTVLHSAVSQQIAFRNSGDIVYDEEGITITWVGMVAYRNNGGLLNASALSLATIPARIITSMYRRAALTASS